MSLFNGCSFVLDLGNLSFKEKSGVKRLIGENGGEIHSVVSSKTICLVCSPQQIVAESFKFRSARNYGCAIADTDYILNCISTKRRLDKLTLAMDGKFFDNDEMEKYILDKSSEILSLINKASNSMMCITAASLTRDHLLKFSRPLFLPEIIKRYYKAIHISGISVHTNGNHDMSIFSNGNFSIEKLREKIDEEKQKLLKEEAVKRLEKEKQFFALKKERLRKLEEEREREALEKMERITMDEQRRAILEARREKERKEKLERDLAEADATFEKLKNLMKRPNPPLVPSALLEFFKVDKILAAAEALKLFEELKEKDPNDAEQHPKDSEKDSAKLSWVNLVRRTIGIGPSKIEDDNSEEEEKKKIISYAGQKIFIGGIKFDDILKKKDDKMDSWTDEKIQEIKLERILEFKASVLRKFGKIIEFQEHWDEGYCFVVYENKDDAQLALKTLKDFSGRRALSSEIKARLMSESKEKLITPSPSYYVRWPSFYVNILEKKKQKKKEKKPATNVRVLGEEGRKAEAAQKSADNNNNNNNNSNTNTNKKKDKNTKPPSTTEGRGRGGRDSSRGGGWSRVPRGGSRVGSSSRGRGGARVGPGGRGRGGARVGRRGRGRGRSD